jgi:hypothetical protein
MPNLKLYPTPRTFPEAADYEALNWLAINHTELAHRPLLLVSQDRSFAIMERLFHQRIGAYCGGAKALALSNDQTEGPIVWGYCVGKGAELDTLLHWAQMCLTSM